MTISEIDYSHLDRPEVITLLFHPRPEWGGTGPRTPVRDVMVDVDENIAVSGRLHMRSNSGANILFFHGNGEIAADYDQLGPLINDMGINFLVFDYRGYGLSTGSPTVTAMMRDCHIIYDFALRWLKENSFTGPLIVMGRSLGSASALELASAYMGQVSGLVVESGFADTGPLLQVLGINLRAMRFKEKKGFGNRKKMAGFKKPTLVVHAEKDHIISLSEGLALYEACPSERKYLLQIPGANHNTIFSHGLAEYMTALKNLAESLR